MSERLLSSALSDLHLLTVLAATRSYTQTAKRLGISKASVSGRISELERSASVGLVRRTSRSVALTEAGQQLVDDLAAPFAQVDESFTSVRDLSDRPRGLVRLSAPVAIGRQLIGPLLPEFFGIYPEVRLELELSDRLVNLQQEGFDVAVRHAHAPPETHVAWVLCETRSWLVATPAYLREHGVPKHPLDLANHRCVAYLRSTGVQRWTFERVRGKEPHRIDVMTSGPFRANNSELLRQAVLGGVGIGLLPDFSCSESIKAGELVPLLVAWRPVGFFGDRIYATRPFAGARVPRAVQCLVDFLRQRLA